jgi:hypothetical protein
MFSVNLPRLMIRPPVGFRRHPFLLGLALVVCCAAPAPGQAPIQDGPDSWHAPVVLPKVPPQLWSSDPTLPGDLADSRQNHVPLFRMFPAFLQDPVGLQSDDDLPPDNSGTSENSRLEVAIGTDNPYFDFRSPTEPGGFGYYKLHTQYQLVDHGNSCLSLGLQAVTPAGLDADGVERGPTVLRPALAWYQDLGNGTGLHGFVAKNVRASSAWTDQLEQSFHYGLALERPLADDTYRTGCCIHMFMEALGNYQSETYNTHRLPAPLELLPGLHWQLRDSWWLSGGLLVPLGTSHVDADLWQITCSWRF